MLQFGRGLENHALGQGPGLVAKLIHPKPDSRSPQELNANIVQVEGFFSVGLNAKLNLKGPFRFACPELHQSPFTPAWIGELFLDIPVNLNNGFPAGSAGPDQTQSKGCSGITGNPRPRMYLLNFGVQPQGDGANPGDPVAGLDSSFAFAPVVISKKQLGRKGLGGVEGASRHAKASARPVAVSLNNLQSLRFVNLQLTKRQPSAQSF